MKNEVQTISHLQLYFENVTSDTQCHMLQVSGQKRASTL